MGQDQGSGRAVACGYVRSGNHPNTVTTTLGRLATFQTPPRSGSLGLLLSWSELGVGSHRHCQRPRLSPPFTISSNYPKLNNTLRQKQQAFILHSGQGKEGSLCSMCLRPTTQMAGSLRANRASLLLQAGGTSAVSPGSSPARKSQGT